MPLFGAGFNEHQQLKPCSENSIFDPVLLNVDSERRVKKIAILWSRIFVVLEDGSIFMLHRCKQSPNTLTAGRQRDDVALLNNRASSVTSCFTRIVTYNLSDKQLLLWDSDCGNSKTLFCDTLKNEDLSFEEIHSADDNKTLLLLTSSGILFKAAMPPGDVDDGYTISLEQLYLIPDRSIPVKVKQVSCGNHHTILLTTLGLVLTFGIGNQGQLGTGSIESRDNPTIVDLLEGLFVSQVSAGGWHSMALTDSGDIYAWGWNNYGQLGLPWSGSDGDNTEAVSIQTLPVCLDITDPIGSDESAEEKDDREFMSFERISCGSRHSLAINSLGDVYSWGWNKYGQLGYRSKEAISGPRKVEMPGRAVEVFAGYWNSIFEVEIPER